jgi:hypothetical protein
MAATPFDYVTIQLVYRYMADEIAVNTFHAVALSATDQVVAPDPGHLQGLAGAVLDVWGTEIASPEFSNQLQLIAVRAYAEDKTTHHAYAEGQAIPATTVKGTATSALPPQVACCVTTWGFLHAAFVPNRARRRGRMYLPGMSASSVASDGLFTTNHISQCMNHVKNLMNSVTNWVPPATPAVSRYRPAVLSVTAGALYPVQEVSVDSIPDIQRRRANALTATPFYTPVAV